LIRVEQKYDDHCNKESDITSSKAGTDTTGGPGFTRAHTLGKYKGYKITLYDILYLSSLCSLHPLNAKTPYLEIVKVEPHKCHLWIMPLDLVSPEV